MTWEQYRSTMERYAIKIDDMASENAYFMATHMPFSQLELFQGGRTSSAPTLVSEDEVFEKIICNPENEHRLVIVRGNNGTGKSHLIRYLKAKYEHSPATIYNPASEQLIFLRRLNNSVRGVFSQLVEQKVITDPDIEAKLRKFISSSDSKDEEAFKTDILYSYIAAVSNDQTGEIYKPVICRDIASYLADSRVREYLLREGGAISKCYCVITAPSDQVLKDSSIFSVEDFNVRKILRSVKNQGDPQASDFATTLMGDEDEITRLVNYLNRFTRDVVQRCADISSESTKTVFTQLRRDLKKQGKNLTLFIEDFTGFTGIDSELITVLSTEHGGNYSDLCRVTAIIGITDAYYDQFRDNFTDRVTHQISVTDRSYGTDDFIVHMAGRYLNAIYCAQDSIRQWYNDGADLASLLINQFQPPCDWETTTIEGHSVTLYPFNSKALLQYYESLPVKSPRMFLKEVIRAQLKEFFNGKEYGDEWDFPMNPANIQMKNGPHSSAIDRLDGFSESEKDRIKSVLAIWGNGSASGVQEQDGTITFGGINKAFFCDIGLDAFAGIGDLDAKTGKSMKKQEAEKANGGEAEAAGITQPKQKAQLDGATKNYIKNQNDISEWFKGAPLKYDADYRGWLRTLIKGDDNQCGAINWQDIGVPAYVAEERLSDLSGYYIEDQKTPVKTEKAIVEMARSAECRDVLLALNEWNYAAKSWEFEGSAYYQQRLITWLEKNRSSIIENVCASKEGAEAVPTLEWCLALQYLKACILGQKIDTSSPTTIISSLFSDIGKNGSIVRETREWNDLIQYVLNKNTEFESAATFLRRASATTMGAVHYSVDSKTRSCYRTEELLTAIEKLIAADWDIESVLPKAIPAKHILFNHAELLKTLYSRIHKVIDAETSKVVEVKSDLQDQLGEISENNITETVSAIQKMFSIFAANSIFGSSALQARFDGPPIEIAKDILKHVSSLSIDDNSSPVVKLTTYADNSLHRLADFARDLQSVAKKAEEEEAKANKDIARIGRFSGLEDLADNARSSMGELYNRLEKMEVYDSAAD